MKFPNKPNQPKILFLRRDQILGDISTQIQIISESRLTDKGTEISMLKNATERFSSQFARWINTYLDKAKSRMAAYIMEPPRKATMNDVIEWEEKTIHLSFPWYWNPATFDQLSGAVHDYIVNSCLYEFFSLALTSKDPVTMDKQILAEDANSMIKHCCVSSLPGTQRKKLQPF